MKKLENILAENMRRFNTKNLNEDADQNNNGYPDDTEGSNAEWTPGQPGRYTNALLQDAAKIMNVSSFNSLKDAYDAMSTALETNPDNEEEIRRWIMSYARYGKY